jgi:hypothetical protein
MKTVTVKLDANGRAQDMSGGFVLIAETLTGADDVTLTWLANGREERGVVQHVSPGRKYKPGFYFDGFQLVGAADATVVLLIGGEGADADLFDTEGLAYITNPAADPVPVDQARPAALTNVAPVAVTAVATLLLAAVAGRRIAYLRNAGAETVALGAAGLTFAAAAIYLLPGETWVEDRAPGAAWFAICDAGLASTVNILSGA